MFVQDVIERALRELNTYASGADPTAAELTDALSAYNTMVLSMFGKEVGPGPLLPMIAPGAVKVLNGAHYTVGAPSGVVLTLSLLPRDGSRFGYTNFSGGAATVNSPVALFDNGAGTSLPSNSNGTFFYRADISSWLREQAQALGDDTIFPDDMDEHLVFMLAARLASSYGVGIPEAVAPLAIAGRDAFRLRYGRPLRAAA